MFADPWARLPAWRCQGEARLEATEGGKHTRTFGRICWEDRRCDEWLRVLACVVQPQTSPSTLCRAPQRGRKADIHITLDARHCSKHPVINLLRKRVHTRHYDEFLGPREGWHVPLSPGRQQLGCRQLAKSGTCAVEVCGHAWTQCERWREGF